MPRGVQVVPSYDHVSPAACVTEYNRIPGLAPPCQAITGLVWAGGHIGVYGFGPLPSLPLNTVLPQGVAGCSLHVSPDVLTAVWTTSLTATFPLPIASDPALVGVSYWHQVAPIELNGGGAMTAITATNALRMTIGLR